ncbi:MAG: response regulator [Gammaproteobacteria bacterium]|nr:response regulator [Gammaproteobacteria bacterium]
MSDQQPLYSFTQIANVLHKLCRENRSGTLYLFTRNSHGAVCAIDEGKIVDIFYRTLRGPSALDQIKQIDSAKLTFKAGAVGNPSEKQGYVPLPSNEEIFRALGIEPEQSAHIAAGNNDQKKRKVVLVVEDSGVTRKIIVRTLTEHGCKVIEAEDGLDALSQLAGEVPDLVLLDLILPKMDGYKVLSMMKRKEQYKDIPVIILTARDSLMDKVKGKVSGTDEYLTKPFKPDQLMTKVAKYLH